LPCVCLTIQDTGTGIHQRHLDSIFDPFFTTKSKGSGLGLYNARLAIEKVRGALSVISAEGAGTSFQIWLPEANFSESNAQDDTTFREGHSCRSLLLLGLPGEVLDKTTELLRSYNYHVVKAASSDGLSDLLQSSDYRFHGMILLAQPNDAALKSLPADIRQQKKDAKIVLKLAGCNQDDLDAQLLAGADLVLSADLAEGDMVAKLKSFLDKKD
jgi:hypothetical protein